MLRKFNYLQLKEIFGIGFGIGIRSIIDDEQNQLLEEEAVLLSINSVPKRRSEFAAGRSSARDAISDLGYLPKAVLRGKGKEPLWPAPLIGSITHSGDFAISVVTEKNKCFALGIDLESLSSKFSNNAIRMICTKEEENWVFLEPTQVNNRLIRLFSAKEAVYKALYPLEDIKLEFKDVCLHMSDYHENIFHAELISYYGVQLKSGFCFNVYSIYNQEYVFSWTYLIREG